MSKKSICDICKEDLYVSKSGYFNNHSFCKIFKSKNPFVIKEYLLTNLFNLGNLPPTNIELCSKCFDDYKEFILRKNSALANR